MKKTKKSIGIVLSLLMGAAMIGSSQIKVNAEELNSVNAIESEAVQNAKNSLLGEKKSGFAWVERDNTDTPRRHWFDAKQEKPGYNPSIAYGDYFNVTDPTSEYFCLPDDAFKWIESQPDSEYYYVSLISASNQYDENGFLTKSNSETYLVDYTMELCILKSDNPVPADKKFVVKNQESQCVQRFVYSFKVEGKELPELIK